MNSPSLTIEIKRPDSISTNQSKDRHKNPKIRPPSFYDTSWKLGSHAAVGLNPGPGPQVPHREEVLSREEIGRCNQRTPPGKDDITALGLLGDKARHARNMMRLQIMYNLSLIV